MRDRCEDDPDGHTEEGGRGGMGEEIRGLTIDERELSFTERHEEAEEDMAMRQTGEISSLKDSNCRGRRRETESRTADTSTQRARLYIKCLYINRIICGG